jgi:hypothetical protein
MKKSSKLALNSSRDLFMGLYFLMGPICQRPALYPTITLASCCACSPPPPCPCSCAHPHRW